jgi:hypothetical protein
MNLFSKSRPQMFFEGVWSESFFVTYLVWEMTLALHSSTSDEVKTKFLQFLESKSKEMMEIDERLFEIRKETAEIFHKNCPEPYEEDWYKFVKEISSFQEKLNPALIRLFTLKDILLQIGENHPEKLQIENALQESFSNLLKAKELVNKISPETDDFYKAVHNAVVLARSINEDVSFEEADRRERKRWE